MCREAKESSPYNITAVCIFSGWGASSAGSVAHSSIKLYFVFLNMQSVCTPVCSAVLRCVFDATHFYWVQHWYCCNAAPSFSEHTYDIPLRDTLWVIFWVRGTLCCTLEGCMHSTGRLPPYWYITKSLIGRSTALTPIGRSFKIEDQNLGALYRLFYPPPTAVHATRGHEHERISARVPKNNAAPTRVRYRDTAIIKLVNTVHKFTI